MQVKTIAQSTKWSALSELLAKLMAPLINIVLARLLTPEIFGLVASFTIVTTFAEVFTDAGFQKYLVQHEFADDDDRNRSTNVAFLTNLGFSCLIWVLICVFKDKVAALVGSPGYGLEISVLSIQIPLVAFSSIQTALFRRDFRFKQLLPIRLTVSAIPLVVTVPLAIIFKNQWAIIIGTLAKEVVNATLLTVKSTWKPTLYYSIKRLKAMLSDCLWMLGDSVMIWLTSYAGTLIVSHHLDTYYLGIYKTGVSTILPYINLIYAMTAPVLFAALSRTQNDKTEAKKLFLDFQKAASFVAIPIGVAIFTYKEAVTLILLGSQWDEASLLVGMVGIAMPFCVLTAQYNSDYFRAMGKPQIAFFVQATFLVFLIAGVIWAVSKPFEVLCITRGCLFFVYSFASIFALDIVFKIRFWQTLANILPSIVASLGIAVIGGLLKNYFSGAIWWQILTGVMGVIVYLLIILIIPSSRKTLLSVPIIKKVLFKGKH